MPRLRKVHQSFPMFSFPQDKGYYQDELQMLRRLFLGRQEQENHVNGLLVNGIELDPCALFFIPKTPMSLPTSRVLI